MKILWLLLLTLVASRHAALAAPGDPFGGDDVGCIPPSTSDRKCEDGVAKAVAAYVQAVLKCHIKAADVRAKGKTFNEELCESDPTSGKGAKEKYDAAIAKLASGCGGQCAVTNAPGLRAVIETILEDRNGLIYACPGTLFGGDDSGNVPPDSATGKCQDGVAKAFTKYAQAVLKCHIKAADVGAKGKTFNEELCESDPTSGKGAKEKYDAAIAKLAGACPACSTANAASIRDLTETDLDCHNGDVYCVGTTPSTCTGSCPATTCTEPFVPVADDVLEAFLYRLGPSGILNVPASCAGSPTVCCPGGIPAASCGPLQIDFVGTSGTFVPLASRFDFTAFVSLKTLADIPVNLPVVGDCGIAIDTAAGSPPTIQIDVPVNFSADLLRMGAMGTMSLSGLTTDDVKLTGGIGCAIANVGLGFFANTLTSTLVDLLHGGAGFENLCRPCGSNGVAECGATVPGCPSVAYCQAAGSPCVGNGQCCSNTCGIDTGQPICLPAPLGGCCGSPSDCSGGTCSGGTCVFCIATGSACAGSADCCSNNCVGSVPTAICE